MRQIPANSKEYGDPAPAEVNKLIIIWRYEGVEDEGYADEAPGAYVQLPGDPEIIKIEQADFGKLDITPEVQRMVK